MTSQEKEELVEVKQQAEKGDSIEKN